MPLQQTGVTATSIMQEERRWEHKRGGEGEERREGWQEEKGKGEIEGDHGAKEGVKWGEEREES